MSVATTFNYQPDDSNLDLGSLHTDVKSYFMINLIPEDVVGVLSSN